MPRRARVLAATLIIVLVAGFATLLHGPWMRVASVSWSGDRFTPDADLSAHLEPLQGASLLTLDSHELGARLGELPAVAEASVELRLPDRLAVEITERPPALLWQTPAALLVVDAERRVIAELARDAVLDQDLARLPRFDDRRDEARLLSVGDRLPGDLVGLAAELHELDPARLGSRSTGLTIRIDGEFGFVLVSGDPAWEAALGFYGSDPNEATSPAERLELQAGAMRTLFAREPEAEIRWVDARNPMKVYFRATDD